SDRREQRDLSTERDEQQPHLKTTAARMIAPWIARSQYAFTPRTVSAGPIAPSSPTPSTVPPSVARPPRIAAPPTTAAAITFISRPSPELLGTCVKRAALTTAARAVSAPASENTENLTTPMSSQNS